MNTFSTSWSCTRCGAAFISTPPEHGLCDQCLADLDAIARLPPIACQPCPMCGGPVCADCGKPSSSSCQPRLTAWPRLPGR